MSETTQPGPLNADLDLIQRILPHRYPFLLVDKVRDIFINESCVGIKCVTANEPQFTGHFPGMPIFPGVMIIEAMAQTSGILVGLSMDLVDKNANVFFMGVDAVKFRRKVVPGDVLELEALTVEVGEADARFKCYGRVEGKVAVEGELTVEFRERKLISASLEGQREPAQA